MGTLLTVRRVEDRCEDSSSGQDCSCGSFFKPAIGCVCIVVSYLVLLFLSQSDKAAASCSRKNVKTDFSHLNLAWGGVLSPRRLQSGYMPSEPH